MCHLNEQCQEEDTQDFIQETKEILGEDPDYFEEIFKFAEEQLNKMGK